MIKNEINNNHSGANFIFEVTLDKEFLVIVDLDIFKQGISVTMDIHNVLKSISNHGYNLYKYKIIYVESDAIYDAILVNKDSTFKAISTIGEVQREKAMTRYIELFLNQDLRSN